MNKQAIVQRVAEKSGLPQVLAKEAVQLIFDAIIEIVVKHKRLELRKFGVFQVKRRRGRIACNPITGESVKVAPKDVVVFKPGTEMEKKTRAKAPKKRAKKQ